MIKKILVLVILILFLGAGSGFAATGTVAGSFLKIGVGGRPVAMGEAYTALADGVDAPYWNPAGIANQEVLEVLSMHADWFQDTSFQYIGFVFPPVDWGVFGVSYSMLNYGAIAGYSATGSREADVNAGDAALNVTWAKVINDKLSLGLNAKFISETLASYSASTFAFDLGALYNLNPDLILGLNFQNQGGSLTFISEANPLPNKIALGIAAKRFIFKPLTVTADFNLPNDSDMYLNVGSEYTFNDFLILRLGYARSRYQGGLGFRAKYFALDYAYVPHEYLGATHRISLALQFGITTEDEIKKHYELGTEYYKEQKYLDALSEFKAVLELDPLNKDSRDYVDRIVEEMRQKTLLEKVKALREQKAKARELLDEAVIEFQKKNYEKAKELVDQSLYYAPDNEKALELKERLKKVLKIEK
ncbi:MAG: PorV/PorQ family protein [Candidatus Margulisbacteria bacterium]|nr:PorV/PorQ family protein [Candidatus Margulisiibacteriota bacterium]MBU1021425.1 PorV/PorQ family protein [Candidatus Margulisiibacteriota bacterium]MBU1728346.1 PorV/PorQ family protein [Candidatus Margulisiibacteriota bacterium]MBU1955911.1 PorV/PorQ family protein [Candidatus Margulisiibacteriota bacterium]